MKTTLVVASCLALGLLSSASRADLAPPSGRKRVSYSFTAHVTGESVTKQVVFSYPCSGSDGAPGRKVTLLGPGASVPVGHHEGCQIYVVAKSAYDAWASDAGQTFDTAADKLIAQARKCDGAGPQPVGELASSDPRSGVNDDIDITVSALSCSMTTRTAPTPAAAAAPSSSSPPAAEKKGGCNASGSSSFPLLLALPALVLLLKKRRG